MGYGAAVQSLFRRAREPNADAVRPAVRSMLTGLHHLGIKAQHYVETSFSIKSFKEQNIG